MSISTPWSTDWRATLDDAVKSTRCDSLLAFARERESDTFRQLAEALAPGRLAPVQVMIVLREEAIQSGQFQYFVMTLLVRYLRERIPSGWRSGGALRTEFHFATASWNSVLTDQFRAECDEVERRLKSGENIPDEWVPRDVSDPFIRSAFEAVTFSLDVP